MPEDKSKKAKQPEVDEPVAVKAAAKKAVSKKPAAEKPEAKRPATKKTAPGVLVTKEPVSDTPVTKEPASEAPVAEGPVADNPLHKKLGLRPGATGLVISPPEDDDNPLLPLPDGFSVLAQLDDLATIEGPFDYIHVFARDRAALSASFAALRDKLAPNASLWISWMKQSGRMSGGMFGDLNENLVRRMALTHAMVDVKIAALDRDWSALRLVRRKH